MKRRAYKISSQIFDSIAHFLSKTRVCSNRVSAKTYMLSGVLKSSVTGSLLLNIYLNDFQENLSSRLMFDNAFIGYYNHQNELDNVS